MAENEKQNEKTVELEINNLKELDEKLKETLKNNPNKPSEEEIEKAKKEFEEAYKNFFQKSWNIGDAKDAQEILEYIQHFVRNRIFWTKNGWMGVIKMMEELNDAEEFLKVNPKENLKMGYQAMEFIFYSFQNAGGIGLQSALDFEKENEIFAKCFDAIGKSLSLAREELKKIQILQDKYSAMSQGFYLEIEDLSENTEKEESENSSENENISS